MGVEEDLLYRIENGVAWLTMNRPQVGNAMTPEVRDRMRDIINDLNVSYEARAIVITATGEKMFCPGADISTDRAVVRPENAPERIVGQNRRMMLNGQLQLMPAIINSELPIIAAVNGTAAGVGAHLALVCDLVPGIRLRADKRAIKQIALNLLSNAVKFTPDGGRITLSASVVANKLILAVSDTGVGIPPEEQEMIFQKFRQASNPLTREQGGSGLGLSIVRELAKLLDGNVTLQSDLGRGSTFTLTVSAWLPLEPLAELESPQLGNSV